MQRNAFLCNTIIPHLLEGNYNGMHKEQKMKKNVKSLSNIVAETRFAYIGMC